MSTSTISIMGQNILETGQKRFDFFVKMISIQNHSGHGAHLITRRQFVRYSGDPNSVHLNTGNIPCLDFLCVQFLNGSRGGRTFYLLKLATKQRNFVSR